MDQVVTLRVSDELAARLETTAKRLHRNRSEIIRLALKQFLESPQADKPVDRVRDLIGTADTGISDLGENHRKYLIERMRRER